LNSWKVPVLQQLDVIERAFDQALGARLAIFLEQVAFQATGIDADADRAAIGLGGIDDFVHPLGATDIARVDAQARRAGIGRLQRSFCSESGCRRRSAPARRGRSGAARQCSQRRAGDADDIHARVLAAPDLVDRRARIAVGVLVIV
jgi:hypothetical protein